MDPMGNTCGDGDDLFSQDVLIQILVWVPVISLLRFKSVCKTWHALIKSSFFIDLHTSFNSSPDTFILQAFEYRNPQTCFGVENKMFMLSSSSSSSSSSRGSGSGGGGGDNQLVIKVDDLGFPPCSKDSLFEHPLVMIGSCNGLICLHDSDLDNVSLWNPATRQFRILPKSISIKEERFDFLRSEFIVFGFDVKTKDYKVVWMSCFKPKNEATRGEGCICHVQVYSLCTDSWRVLEEGGINLPALPADYGVFVNNGVYLNGSYFFVGEKFIPRSYSYDEDGSKILVSNNRNLMFSFDFTKEIFTTMQFPDHNERHRSFTLRHFGEKIVVFTIQDREPGDELYDMWVLNEHGSSGMNNKESWTKIHSFLIETKYGGTSPMCILNDGEFALMKVFERTHKLRLFNLLTKEVHKVLKIGDGGVLTKKVENGIIIGNGMLRANLYHQSLVSITGGSGVAASLQPAAMCKWLVVRSKK